MATGVNTPAVTAVFSANGLATGYVTVASTTGFLAGATANLSDTAGNYMLVTITSVGTAGAGLIGVKALNTPNPINTAPSWPQSPVYIAPNYGRTSVVAFLTANTATITQPAQWVFPYESVQT